MPPASAEPIEQTPPVGLSRSAGLTLGQVGALAGFWVLTRRRRAAASG
jgi:hypothetical protein